MPDQFVKDDAILVLLKNTWSIDWIAAKLGTTRERVRSVRDRNKVEILTARIEEHKQSIDTICYQLDLMNKRTQLINWYTTKYGDGNEN